jgi:O-antigen ligase
MNITKPKTWAFIALGLLALLPVLPLLAPWHLDPIRSFHDEGIAMLVGLLSYLAFIPLIWRNTDIAIPKTVLLPILLLLYIGFQALLLPQVVPQHAQLAMFYLLWAALLMTVVATLKNHLGAETVGFWLAVGLALAASLAAGMELAMRLQGQSGWWGGLGQANNYGDLLALGALSLLYWHKRMQKARLVLYVLAVLILFGLSLTQSRSVWLYFAASLVLAWIYQRRWFRPVLASFIAYLLFQGLLSLDVMPQQQQTSAERLVQEIGGAPIRWHIWQVAWKLFLQSPILGQGFGQFDWAYFQAGNHVPLLTSRLEHAHNLFLHLLAELGLLPVMLLSIGLFRWLKPLIAQPDVSADKDKHAPPKDLHAWLLMLIAVLGIHSLLEYPLWYAQFLGLAALLLSLGDSQRWQINIPKPATALLGGLVSVAIALCGFYQWQYTKIELALLATTTKPTPEKFDYLVGVCQEVPDKSPLLTPYVPVIFTLAGNVSNKKVRSELTALADASFKFWPTSILAYRQALMQGLSGQDAAARKTLKLAMAAYPQGVDGFFKELMHLTVTDLKRIEPLLGMTVSAAIKQGMIDSALPQGNVETRALQTP